MTLTLNLHCAGAQLYACPATLATVLGPDDIAPPVVLHPALSNLTSLMDMVEWLRRPFAGQLSGYCSTCTELLEELAAGHAVLATPEQLFELLRLADMAADSLDTVRSWIRQAFDHAARNAARSILKDPAVHAARARRDSNK